MNTDVSTQQPEGCATSAPWKTARLGVPPAAFVELLTPGPDGCAGRGANSLSYKTPNGARAGDLFMRLIHACELNGANPFDYLAELQRHAEELKHRPIRVDALESPRDTVAAGKARRRVIS
jgi:hypothetical protein